MTTSGHASNGGWEQLALPFTSSPADLPARDIRSLANNEALLTSGGGSLSSGTLRRRSGRRGSSSRTSPTSPVPVCETSSSTLPISGSMRGGAVSPRRPWALRISAGDSSSLLPTPTASSYGTNRGGAAGRTGPARPSLATMARHGLWPTPGARLGDPRRGMPTKGQAEKRYSQGRRNLDDAVVLFSDQRGPLNPEWVEWLMGLPAIWTKLD
jgi:hypothetical protein